MKLGDKILELRKKKGFSQEELGEKVNVTRQTISNWELGETAPNPEQLKLLSKHLNVSVDELLDNDIKNVLVEKVSNTEKLAGLILKIIKIVLIGLPVLFILLIIASIIYKNVKNIDAGRDIEETIHCKLYGEEHSYSIIYKENTRRIIGEGGDSYFYDILDLGKYNDANQIFNVINDYVKKNGGTCDRIDDYDLNDIVNMHIKEGTLTKNSATVIIEEKTDYDITYGESFWIEKYNSKTGSFDALANNTDNNCGFNMIGYIVTPDTPLELKQNWSCQYGNLDKGHYRLVKDVSFTPKTPVVYEDAFYVWTEFDIDD